MPKRYWYVILTYILMQFSGLIGFPLLAAFNVPQENWIGTWTIISFPLAIIIVLLLLRPDMKKPLDRDAANVSKIILWSIIGVFLAMFAQIVAAQIEILVFGIEPGSENTQDLMKVARMTPLFILVPAIFAPILEELIFRKIIFGSIYQRTNFFVAAIISSLVFALVHADFTHTLVYTAMGLVFAFLYVKTKRIIVPIFAHMAMNTLVVVTQYNLTPEDIERMQKQLENIQTILIGGL